MEPRELFVEHLALIERITRGLCRRNCCKRDEAEDFEQTVKVKLIDDDYAILGKFQGLSTLPTYLTTVITRLFYDYRIAKWGKWRPSAAATRLGDVGVQLDVLLHRDGYTLREAIEILKTNYQVEESKQRLEEMAALLPARSKRRFEGEEALEQIGVPGGVEDRVVTAESTARLERVETALAEAMKELASEDWLLCKMRYFDAFSVAEIARTLQFEQRTLYSRFDKIRKQLREALERRLVPDDLDFGVGN